MSSYTDFYVGRGGSAEWIGSLRGESCPDNVRAVPPLLLALTTTDEDVFRAAVADTLDVWEDERLGQGYRPGRGWPWPWHSSHFASWIVVFDPEPGAVFVTVGGGTRWHRIDPRDPRFPDRGSAGTTDVSAWQRDRAAPPSVPMPLMLDKPADAPVFGGEVR
ncbi:hypothetical protein [Amycolatopsis rubida]|uniref:Uncharacterized protein n=1 Tax=Amycolatopsis rubida TaxID=112413 RepID=A0A1I5E014_9PSEU|nr:hypothetical protein [Amycolatopsis rubida]SFO04838.1 hypothetical protein SAMN05421854_101429 [Amycolatopsis rubida]